MNKPPHQKIAERIRWLILGIIALGAILGAFTYSIELINLKIALWSTISFCAIYTLLIIFFKTRQVKWISNEGKPMTLLDLSKKLKWSIAGSLLLIWLPVIFEPSKRETIPSPLLSASKRIQPIFDLSDKRFKILVLPFKKISEYQGKAYDIGKRICMRLDSLSEADTLNLVTHYLVDTIDFSNFTFNDADSLVKFHNADQIIYGFYSFKECEGGTSDKVCFNYRTGNRLHSSEKIFKGSSKWADFDGLQDIRNGTGQESIEYIIYMVASYSARKYGEIDKAIRKLQRIRNFEKNVIVLGNIGDCYYLKNEILSAKEYYEKALKIDTSNFQVWNNLGYVLYLLKDFKKSKECLEKSLWINPNFEIALHNLGHLYLIQGDFEKGKECLLKALTINPNNEIAWNNIGGVYRGLNDSVNEKKSYERGLNLNPSSQPILVSLGSYYGNRNDPRAVEYFERVLQLYPNDALAMHNLGVYYLRANNNLKAFELLQNAVRIRDNYIDAWIDLANVCESLGQYDEMKKSMEKALNIDSNSAWAWFTYGNYFADVKNFDKAIKCYKKSSRIKPVDEEVWFNLGKCFTYLKKYTKGKKCYEKAYTINPNDPQVWEELGNINYFVLENYGEAEKWFLKELPFAKQQKGVVYYKLAKLNSIQRNETKTLFYVKQSIYADPPSKLRFIKEKDFSWLFMNQEFINLTR
jgi:tetratricopeptide (TPR) repeat protein